MKFKDRKYNYLAIVCVLISQTVFANEECKADIELIDKHATSTAPITPEQMQEVISLRNKGQADCESGLINEGLASLSEAKAILKIN